MNEPSRRVIARVSFNHPPSGHGLEPKRVEHLQLGLSWHVTEILDRWEHPGSPEQVLGKPDLIKWWLLKVSGPLLGRGVNSRASPAITSARGMMLGRSDMATSCWRPLDRFPVPSYGGHREVDRGNVLCV